MANFIITSENIFDKKAKIYENWIQGNRYEISKPKDESYYGKYILSFNSNSYQMVLGKKSYVLESKLIDKNTPEDSLKSKQISISPNVDGDLISFSFEENKEADKWFFTGWKTEEGFSGKLNQSAKTAGSPL